MPNHDATNIWPTASCIGGEQLEPRNDLLGPCLVIDMGNAGRTISMITNQTAEDDNCSAIGQGDPVRREADIERSVG